MKMLSVLAWTENTGLKDTGKLHRPDGVNWAPVFEPCLEAKACVWSSDPKRFEDGRKYAESNNMKFMLMEDTENVLSLARKSVLQSNN